MNDAERCDLQPPAARGSPAAFALPNRMLRATALREGYGRPLHRANLVRFTIGTFAAGTLIAVTPSLRAFSPLCAIYARRNRLSTFLSSGMCSMASKVAALVLAHGTLLQLIAGCTAGDASQSGDRRVMHDTIRALAARCALSSPLVIRSDSQTTTAGAALLQRYDVHDIAARESTGDPAGPDGGAARIAILALAPTTDPVGTARFVTQLRP